MTSFHSRRTDLLLEYILVSAAQEDEWRDRELGPIHLVKYVYLGDLAFAATHGGESFTGAEWLFYHFGPWQAQVHDRIEPALSAIRAERKNLASARYEGDIVRFFVPRDRELDVLRDRLEAELPLAVTAAVRSAVHEFGADTVALLRHVYLTPPMVSAAPGETLALVFDQESGSTGAGQARGTATAAQRRRRTEILSALQKNVQRRLTERRTSRDRQVSPPPRYDAVFAAGTEWLDALAGEPAEGVSGEVTVSQDVWKSPTRTEPDVP